MFVSGAAPFVNRAYIDRVDGTTYFTSELGDSDELPADGLLDNPPARG